MTEYYHNIEEEISLGIVKADRVLKHISHQNQRIEELTDEVSRLEVQCKGLAQAAINNGQGLIIAEAKLADAVEALQWYDDPSSQGDVARAFLDKYVEQK